MSFCPERISMCRIGTFRRFPMVPIQEHDLEDRHPTVLNLVRALHSMPQRDEEEKSELQEKGIGNAHSRGGRRGILKKLMDEKCVDCGKRFVQQVQMDYGIAGN